MPVTFQPAVKTDARVRSDVLSEIAWDPFVRDVPVNQIREITEACANAPFQ